VGIAAEELEAIFARELNRVASIEDLLERERRLQAIIRDFEGLHEIGAAESLLASLVKDKDYRKRARQGKRADRQERRKRLEMNRVLIASERGGPGLTPADRAYWTRELADLERAIQKGNQDRALVARRLEEHLRAACFERPIGALYGSRWNAAINYAQLGQMIAPEIGAFHYIEACARAGRGDDREALAALEKAVALGRTGASTIGHRDLLARLAHLDGYDTLIASLDAEKPGR